MKKIIFILFIIILLPFSIISPQMGRIEIEVIQDISSLNLGAFAMANDLQGQPRFFQVIIEPWGKQVYVIGQVFWKQDLLGGFEKLVDFETEKFEARNFFNDEIGSTTIGLRSVTGNRSRVEELARRGTPTGVVRIILQLFDANGNFMADNSMDPDRDLIFLNPTAPVIRLENDQVLPLGNLVIFWDSDPAARNYIVRANVKTDLSMSDEAALNTGDPLINNVSVGEVNTVNLNDLDKRRDFLPGETIVVQVKKLVFHSGFPKELPSNPVRFKIQSMETETPVQLTPNDDLVRLANLIAGSVDQNFVEKLRSGEIQPNQLQIFGNENNEIQFSEFVTNILNKLLANPGQFLIVNFTPKQ